MPIVQFFVPGTPKPQGSMRAFQHRTTGAVVTMASNTKQLKPWRADVAGFAMAEGVKRAVGPVTIRIEFFMPRPKSHFLHDRLRATAPTRVDKKPDVDKLVRAVLDALTGVAWHDDAQVAKLQASKEYIPAAHGPGCRITLYTEDSQ